ncbi:NYN domain limkain-b1-type [Arabidopsis suecica]|uniref:NYN domain limkain-b1-type n=1 Tax=Arabidopsis suecica TaxID=45249 RepID=A0A8T2A091_ARASU|nr:NYN domain limkain-b1-type [Arabidopsis suecica]
MTTEFANDSTGVFWDLDDCSNPNDSHPHLIYQNIKSALENKGYRGEVSISAYVQDETLPDDLLDIFREAGVKISFVPKDSTHKRVARMFLDILLWAVDNPHPANLMIISNNFSEHKLFLKTLHYLKQRHYNVLLAEPGKVVSEEVRLLFSDDLLENLIKQSEVEEHSKDSED